MASNGHTKDSHSCSPTSDYEKWKQYIIDIGNETKDRKTTEWNIYEVPCTLRNLNEEAYTPQLASKGPSHHDLKPMQEQKLQYLKLFWSHVTNKTKDMDKFKKFLEDEEDNIRKSYAENLCNNLNREKLAEMMLLDSVFIMGLFLRIQNVEKQIYPDDIIVKQSWLNKSILRDLLLLENQIPLFILEELYNTHVPDSKKKHPTFIELARDHFDCYHTYEEKKSSTGFARFMMNCGTYKKGDSSVEKTGSSDSKGQPPRPKHFTDLISYVSSIDSLIHTKDDVKLLVKKEVIVHELGTDKEVATLANDLCKHVIEDKTCYMDTIINALNKHYQRQWSRTMASLRLVYFRDAWRASPTSVATAVLVFTILNLGRIAL